MNRAQKQELISFLQEKYNSNSFIFILTSNKVTADTALEFRSKVRKLDSYAIMAKNTISHIVSEGSNLGFLVPHFKGQTITILTNNPTDIAKIFKEYEDLGYEVVAGTDKTSFLDKKDVLALATLPSIPEIRAQLLSVLLSPHRKFLRTLKEAPASFVRVLSEYSKKDKKNVDKS